MEGSEGNLKINSPSGSIYDTEGYRLPTSAEHQYLVRDLGKSTVISVWFGDESTKAQDYGWCSDNADHQLHEVGKLKPMHLNGHDFYDLVGNTWEWCHDASSEPKGSYESGINPEGIQVKDSSKYKIIRGGSFRELGCELWPIRYFIREAIFGEVDIGFRLVRTLDPK